ncbi:hypothetical protein RND71_028992 [Anisodus tanguticus]|uniref:Uncharacterized protein n=1 Tax=Anisodus tanguticus TaxID=243964 RepID=A0AAE1RJD5_9SOLA|nr:hypothetical protein RND71_028992 [Anisodus tanguticus]
MYGWGCSSLNQRSWVRACGKILGHPSSSKMEFFSRNTSDDSLGFQQGIVRCPFLTNINEPTNFSFSSSVGVPIPVRGGKGPIFEDGPNFDMAFRLFDGQNGAVPLSGRLSITNEKQDSKPALCHFNPLAAKAATISLSAFGFGGPFVVPSSEYCPSSCSKDFSAPPGVKLKCPPAIVASRAALSRTAFAKNLRPQPLPAKVLVIGVLGMAANIPLGIWREHTEKFSPSWFAAVHAAVPFIGILRKSVLMPKTAIAFTIAASVLGQVIGSRAERYRLKAVAARELVLMKNSTPGHDHLVVDGVLRGML